MLTMKHVMDGKEFVQEIGSFVADTRNGQLYFTAYESDEFGPTAGTWGGSQMPKAQGVPGELCATIYIMNSRGSTVANYRYWLPTDSLIENGAPLESATV